MKETVEKYITWAKELKSLLAPMQKTDEIYPKVRVLIQDMQKIAMETNDDMLHPILYNAAATVATAPEGCSARQLSEALEDAICEMEMMKEYL